MGIWEYLRNQNYGWLIFNKNLPYNRWWWWLEYDWMWNAKAKTFSEDDSAIDRVAKSFSNLRSQVKQRSSQQVISDLIDSQSTMYWSAMSNRNKATSAQEMKAAQLDAFAAIVKWRAIEDWYEDEWDEYNNTKDIIWHYIDLNNSDAVNNRLIQYANSQEDPYDFAMEMWVLLTSEQKRIRNAQAELDTLFWKWNTPKWLAKTYDFLANQMVWWLSSWVDPIEKWDFNEMFANSDSDEAPILGAIENYSYRTFWKHLNNLDEYEMNKILNDLKDTETLKKYLPNEATAIANKFEWATYGALFSAFPVATLSLEWISSIPVVWDITSWTLRNIARWVWQALTYSILSPLAWPLSYNLNNEDERLDFYEALWAVFLWRDHENNWWVTTRGKWDKKTEWAFNKFLHSDAKETLWNKLWEEVVNVDETKVNAWEWQTVLWWIKDIVKKRNENKKLENQKATQESIYDKANKTLVNPEVWENKQAADAYMQLDDEAVQRIKKSKNKSKAVLEEFDRLSKTYENAENAIVNTIDKMYWIDETYENPISTKAWWKEYTSNKPRQYIREWIDIMKEIAEYQEEQQYIDLAEQIANDWNLTPYNVIEMARSLSKQFDLWSKWKEWPELSKMKARVDSTRQWLKDMLKRELDRTTEWQEVWVNPLEYYDSLWSPVIWTRSNIVKLRSAWNKAKSRIVDPTILNKVWTWLDKIPFTKARAARIALESLQWERIMSMIKKEKDLGKIVDEINKLSKKLPKDATKEQIDAIMKDWADNHPWMMEDISVLEWEVIEPEQGWKWYKWRNPYLEEMFETVDIEDPNLYLKEDPNYNWNPVDYTDVTMVDSDWYPWKPWQTTESYKGQKKWEWWTPEAWNKETTEPVDNTVPEWTKAAENYAAKYGNTLEWWKAQLEAAWISPEAIEILLEKLAKKNFKATSVQPSIFDISSMWWEKVNLADIAKQQADNTKTLKKWKKSWKKSEEKDK